VIWMDGRLVNVSVDGAKSDVNFLWFACSWRRGTIKISDAMCGPPVYMKQRSTDPVSIVPHGQYPSARQFKIMVPDSQRTNPKLGNWLSMQSYLAIWWLRHGDCVW